MNRLSDYSFIPERPIEARAGDMNWLVFKLFREFKSPQRHSEIAIEGLVMTMLAELSRGLVKQEEHAPKWLDRVVELLRAEFQAEFIHQLYCFTGWSTSISSLKSLQTFPSSNDRRLSQVPAGELRL